MKTPKLLNWLAAAFFAFAPVSNAQEAKQIKPFSQEYTAITSDFNEVQTLVKEKLKVETARSDAVRKDGTRELGLLLSSDTEIKDTYIGLVVPWGFKKKDVKVWTQRRVINPSSPKGDEYRVGDDSKRIPLENELNFLRHIAFDLINYEQRTFGIPGKSLQGKKGDLKILEDALASNREEIISLDYEPRNCVQLGYKINYTLPPGNPQRISAIVLSRSSLDKTHLFRQTAPFFTQEEAKVWLEQSCENNLAQINCVLESYVEVNHKFPDKLEDTFPTYANKKELFICPLTGLAYTYVSGLKPGVVNNLIVVYDSKEHNREKGFHTLFLKGHTEILDRETLKHKLDNQ